MTVVAFPGAERHVGVQHQKIFYPLKVPVDHTQLRQLLAYPVENQLYYVQSQNVYCLDTSTQKRTHILELPFKASCMAAAHGWLCAGGHGDGGHFAAVKLPEPSISRLGIPRPHTTESNQSLPYRMRHEHLGNSIINSVSIHRLPAQDHEAEDEVVAVATNNDCTVRVYSLTKSMEQDTLGKYDFPMNHASISPDGSTMFLVGDRAFAYVYARGMRAILSDDELVSSSSEWTFLRKVPVYKPQTAKNSAFFTTTWSTSGRLCATASEHGYITVFDTERLRNPDLDPVVALAPSSRPNSTPGAVRAMSFAPEPWDLLVWTESNGRMCVADLRSGLNTRQVIALDSAGESIKIVQPTESYVTSGDPEIPDAGSEIDLIRRHQRALAEPNNAAAVSFATDYLANSSERRRYLREAGIPELDDDAHGLTEQEQQILDGIRTTRQRELITRQRELVSTLRNISQRGLHYTQNDHHDRGADSTRGGTSVIGNSSAARRRNQLDQSAGQPQDNAELSHETALLGSMRDYMRLSRFDDSMASHGRPPRQPNTVIVPSQLQPTFGQSRSSASSGDPWHTIEAALQTGQPPSADAVAPASRPPHNASSTTTTNRTTLDPNGDSMPDLLPFNTSTSSSSSPRTSTRATLPNIRERVAYLDAERRRIQQLTGAAPPGNSSESLTTRGEVMYARVERERERAAAEREGDPRPSVRAAAAGGGNGGGGGGGGGGYEASFIRQMRAARNSVGLSPTYMTSEPDGIDDSQYPQETWGIGTSGMCWGDGGRVLYVGTEKGIFELKLDFQERKYWPAISMR